MVLGEVCVPLTQSVLQAIENKAKTRLSQMMSRLRFGAVSTVNITIAGTSDPLPAPSPSPSRKETGRQGEISVVIWLKPRDFLALAAGLQPEPARWQAWRRPTNTTEGWSPLVAAFHRRVVPQKSKDLPWHRCSGAILLLQ